MFLRKYGTGTGADVIIPIIKRGVVDFAVTADWTPASGDVKVSKDGAAEANIGTLPVINGTTGWKFVFSDAELQCKSLTVRVVDSATKAIEDQFFIVETYGNASAMYPVDLSASVLPVNVTHFGGTAGTFASGIPAANATKFAGQTITAAAGVTIPSSIASPTNITAATGVTLAAVTHTGAVIPTVSQVTGLTASNLDVATSTLATAANLAIVAGYLDTEIAAIKTKTDQLTFTTANKVDSTAVLDSASVNAVADQVWNEAYSDHTTAGTFGKLMDVIRKANLSVDGTVSGTPTVNTFDTDLTDPTSTYKHQLLVFTSGSLEGVSRPILSYTQTNGVIVLQEDLPSAPSANDEFTILVQHVHPISEIQDGLARTGNDGDTLETLSDQIDGISVGGGSATLEKQEEILAAIQGSEVIQVASPNVSGNLVLTQGDDYDGVANPKATWTVSTDYTSGWTVAFTIRDVDDEVIYTTTGTVASSTSVQVTIAAPTGLTMTGCPGQWQGKFDVELTHTASGAKKTIAIGVCYINEDQTRA